MADKVIFRNDLLKNWEKVNPILSKGEAGFVMNEEGYSDTYKMGDGIHKWTELPSRTFNGNIVQDLNGTSETDVPSQNAVKTAIDDLINSGFVFQGIASPNDPVDVPKLNVFYLANTVGTYTHYGNVVMEQEGLAIIMFFQGMWVLNQIFSVKQELGDSESDVVSQKVVSNSVRKINSITERYTIKSTDKFFEGYNVIRCFIRKGYTYKSTNNGSATVAISSYMGDVKIDSLTDTGIAVGKSIIFTATGDADRLKLYSLGETSGITVENISTSNEVLSGLIKEINKTLIKGTSFIENSEFVWALLDENKKVIWGIYKNGDIYENGISNNEKKISEQITQLYNSLKEENERNLSNIEKRKLLFFDDFDKGIDENIWFIHDKISTGDHSATALRKNVKCVDGVVDLMVKRESITNGQIVTPYSMGKINTQKFNYLYGRLEFKAKFKWQKGMWPALWTVGKYGFYAPVIGCNEIDLMESFGGETSFVTFHRTMEDWGFGNFDYQYEDTDSWHIYALELKKSGYEFYIDNKKVCEGPLEDINWKYGEQMPFTIILDNKPMPEEREMLEGHLLIDWVKVYAPSDDPVLHTLQSPSDLKIILLHRRGEGPTEIKDQITFNLDDPEAPWRWGLGILVKDGINFVSGKFESDDGGKIVEWTRRDEGFFNMIGRGEVKMTYRCDNGIEKSFKMVVK